MTLNFTELGDWPPKTFLIYFLLEFQSEMKPISIRLPIEIEELIIDRVADGQTFISCSLVCRAWLARCRFYLFKRISISPARSLLASTMLCSPSKAGQFVRSLVVTNSAEQYLGK